MRSSASSEHSLRVLIYLGVHDAQLAAPGQIANAYGISAKHLTEVAH